MYQILLQYFILMVLGLLFVSYASLNVTLSYAPSDLSQITQNYGKTYAIQVTTPADNAEEVNENIRRTTSNSTTLMILSMVGGIYLVLFSIYRIVISTRCGKN